MILVGDYARDERIKVPGVSFHDEERGVTYNVTIAGGEGRVWLRSVEVVLDDPTTPPDIAVYRFPAQRLADAAAIYLANQQDGEVAGARASAPPTTEQLAELVAQGMTRRTLATRYGRSVPTVDGWLGAARRERPDLFPAQRRGPKPRRSR